MTIYVQEEPLLLSVALLNIISVIEVSLNHMFTLNFTLQFSPS